MAACCFLPSAISRWAAAASLRFFEAARFGEDGLLIKGRDSLRCCLEIHPQRTLDGHLEKAELAVLEDAGDDPGLDLAVDLRLGCLAVLEVAVNAGQVV